MLLKFMIAILSTAHAQVEANVGTEPRSSRARIFDDYRAVVKEDMFPAPFNLVSLDCFRR